MVTVPENKPEGEFCAHAFGVVRCYTTAASANLMCLVVSCSEILAILSKCGVHGKSLHACVTRRHGFTKCCLLYLHEYWLVHCTPAQYAFP